MNENLPQAAPSSTPAKLQNGLELWASETGTSMADLFLIRIDSNESLVIPFTADVLRVTLHFVEAAAYRGYVHCHGTGCLLCRIGRQSEVRDLLPIYDAQAKAVGVLPVSANLRPGALRPQLAPILRNLQEGGRLVLAIRKLDTYRYRVVTLPVADDVDDGAGRIAAFLAQLQAGALDLGTVYPRLGNEELAALPEVATAMRVKGMTLP